MLLHTPRPAAFIKLPYVILSGARLRAQSKDRRAVRRVILSGATPRLARPTQSKDRRAASCVILSGA